MASSSELNPSTKRLGAGEREDVLGTSSGLWRVCRRRHADLSGLGASRASGRWHTKDEAHRALYCAADPSTAILEVVVRYLDEIAEAPPADLVLVTIAVDRDRLAEVRRDQVIELAPEWPEQVERTRACGDGWLAAGKSLALTVPSALSPVFNVVVNAKHAAVADVLRVEQLDPLAEKIVKALAGLRAVRGRSAGVAPSAARDPVTARGRRP